MEMYEYLGRYREEMPDWLINYHPSDILSFKDILSGRVAYYPGFGCDGSMLKVGNMSHAVHSFIHTDYRNSREDAWRQIQNVKGYHPIGIIEWSWTDVLHNGSYPFHLLLSLRQKRVRDSWSKHRDGHIITSIMERNADLDDSFGAQRIAVTTVCADGIEFYFQVFVMEYRIKPWLFLLQDHGMGGNYDRFGKGGLLSWIMAFSGSWPEFIICVKDKSGGTYIYDRYELIEEAAPIIGGMHRNVRYLWRNSALLFPRFSISHTLALPPPTP